MRRAATLGLILVLCLIGVYVSWRAKAPSWLGRELDINVPAPETFEILLVGDTGTGSEGQVKVAAAMEAACERESPLAVILLGDNFYPNGVATTDDTQWQSKFRDIYQGQCLSRVPFYAALGNHDYMQNPAAQIAFTSPSPPWYMPHRFYRLLFGDALQLVVTDTNVLDLCGLREHCALDFLFSALKQKFRSQIVVGHHPIVSSSVKYRGETIQGKILRQVLCHQADFYFSGHAHHLEHRYDEQCGLEEVISGGGGAPLAPIEITGPEVRFAKVTYGFASLKVEPGRLTLRLIDEAGQELHKSERKVPADR